MMSQEELGKYESSGLTLYKMVLKDCTSLPVRQQWFTQEVRKKSYAILQIYSKCQWMNYQLLLIDSLENGKNNARELRHWKPKLYVFEQVVEVMILLRSTVLES